MTWLTPTIGDVCLPTLQGDPARNGRKSFRYVDIAGIDRDSKSISRADDVPSDDAPSRARKIIEASDVLVSTVRPNLNAIALVPEGLDGEIASTGFTVLRANRQLLDPKYLFYWAQTKEFIDFLTANSTGASYPAVTDGVVKRARILLATPREQSRIVELLDEAARLRRLRRDADAKAVRILPALFVKMFGDPASNPMGWSEKQLSQVIKSVDAGWSASGAGRPREGIEYGVLKVSAVTSGVFRPKENKAVIDTEIDRPLIIPRRGDLLFSRANTRELVAASCIVEADYQYLFLPDKLWRVVPIPGEASGVFLKELFWQDGIRDKFRAASSGSSGSMLNISKEAMLRTTAPIPPFHLQKHFESLAWSVVAALNRTKDAAEGIDSLWSSLLQRAFSGQLTVRWREAHMKELLVEMAHQAHALNLPLPKELEALP
ncbi:restriction endonuclease subunit S domain-containing protein [Paraburkholderia bannensis]|uniref:restriction endonuclease subunit S n=1 Tax=Paraburkholderia bannensis TaxID=765414 RepID=UPI000AFFF3F0|nr:restriction endonuclease subunit S [Paraburkholderia bannensis]